MSGLGELERAVMEEIWSRDTALSAGELRAALAGANSLGREFALTTLLTVLARLERKNFVTRDRTLRPATFSAHLTRAEHTAELMHEVLGRSSDRDAALARFVGTVAHDDVATLRRLLERDGLS